MSDSNVQVQVIKSSLSLRGNGRIFTVALGVNGKRELKSIKILVNTEQVFTKFLDMLCKK